MSDGGHLYQGLTLTFITTLALSGSLVIINMRGFCYAFFSPSASAVIFSRVDSPG